ncbi:FadR/GntR family transcriptional regulator [Actinocatenispora thailandica]|uniref:FadR/GntR family transcriptional regulator n=1 Tax=Actinocatenispora thailandica TaxID=227318 RepID=UPI001951E37C|nr:FCD domain-containing protein [Actinocatenispora thailandica]
MLDTTRLGLAALPDGPAVQTLNPSARIVRLPDTGASIGQLAWCRFQVGRSMVEKEPGMTTWAGTPGDEPAGTSVPADPRRPELIRYFLETSEVVGPAMAALAARRASHEEIRRMWALSIRVETADDDMEASVRSELAFHQELAQATHNPVLLSTYLTLLPTASACARVSLSVAGAPRRSGYWHRQISQAIESGDPQRAANTMCLHVRQLLAELGQAELLAPTDTAGPLWSDDAAN